jgi:hypothetical protein
VARVRATATKVRHGVYTDGDVDAWGLYDLRCAAVLESLNGAVLAGPSAARYLGLPFVGNPPTHVYVRGVRRGTYGTDVKVVSGGRPDVAGPVVTAPWAVADCARILPRRDALIIADAAAHLGMCAPAELEAVTRSLGRSKGVGRARWISRHVDGRSESPGETWLRMIVRDLGYDVECQVTVVDGRRRPRIDLVIADAPVGLEFDGLLKYGEKIDEEEAARRILEEKRRQGRLELLGYHILRFIWEQLFDPVTVGRRIQFALRGQVPVRREPVQTLLGW